MSIKKQIIEITPGLNILHSGKKELIESKSHECVYCRGIGYFWQDGSQVQKEQPCPICNGSGQLDAIITIEWKPSGQTENSI